MTEEGKAYDFCIGVADRYFRDRMGTTDQIVIAQISGSNRALLWQGTPLQLRKDFPSPEAFNTFLQQKADPNASLVYDGITQTLDYVSSDPDIASGNAKSAVLVLSDMIDSGPEQGQSAERMKQAIGRYGQAGGSFGVYFCDQHRIAPWRDFMRSSGVRNWCVEADVVSKPQLPLFE